MLGLVGAVFTLSSLGLVGLVVGAGHLELLPPGVERCVLFDSIRGPLQSVQCAELWGFILALQCPSAIHLGVDNLNVVHVSRILDGRVACGPFELTNDGDLLTIIEKMILQRGIRSCG